MADDNSKTTYPKVPTNSWFALRERAKNSPSAKITPEIVAALFDLASSRSAQDNIVRPLTLMALIDENGSLTKLGNLWRNDDTYEEACSAIVEALYPEDLVGLDDPAAIERWFAGRGFGASNARQMARTYRLLAEPNLPEEVPEVGPKREKAKRQVPKQSATTREDARPDSGDTAPKTKQSPSLPSLQMNLQIHLPENATPEQIDTIFASMAKHIYGK